ncbi:MAG: hypothetical protein ACOC7Y_03030 [Chloroflexota bacterium]
MPQGTCENPWHYVQIGFIVCAVMVILLLLLRGPRDYPPTYQDYRRGYPVYQHPDYPERRGPGGVLILMLFTAFVLATVAVLTS